MKNENYKSLFDELYEFYKNNGDSDKTWCYIINRLSGYISCQLHSSKLSYSLYDDGYSYIISSIPTAFRSYKENSAASVFTWVTRLFKQAIWRYIRDTLKQDEISNNSDYDVTLIDTFSKKESVESEFVENEDIFNKTELLEKILRTVLRCDVYFDVFCWKKGLFGCDKLRSDEEIARQLQLTLKTVAQANCDNKIRIGLLKKFLVEYSVDELNKESFEQFRKQYFKKQNK